MTSGQDAREQAAREQVSAAGLRLREAAEKWNAVDLAAIGNCVESLEQTAGELGQALEVLRDASPEALRSLQAALLDLKKAAGHLERLSDASAAFLRCAPGAPNEATEFYELGGAVRYSTPEPDADTRGMQA